MPVENMEDQGLEKNPNLELAHWKFLLTVSEPDTVKYLYQQIFDAIKKDDMAPWYELLCRDMSLPVQQELLQTMRAANKSHIQTLDAVIADAERNLGEMEVRDAYLKKAEYYSRIGDKALAVKTFAIAYEKTVSLGHRLDIVFHLIRIGLFFMDHDIITRNIEKAKTLIEDGGDWDRRNRLKVYQGVYCMAIRDFKTACTLFLDTISTFTSYELMTYKQFVRYTVYMAIISLPRNKLRDMVIRGSEILEVLHTELFVKTYLFSLYDCQYEEFFTQLIEIENTLQTDYLLHPHYRYYIREMRILAYSQLLESYRSLTLEYMADAFGVSESFMDKELATFISSGRLHCKIDRIGGIVETTRPDLKNAQFNLVVKQGDLLLNRVQKLSRVINI